MHLSCIWCMYVWKCKTLPLYEGKVKSEEPQEKGKRKFKETQETKLWEISLSGVSWLLHHLETTIFKIIVRDGGGHPLIASTQNIYHDFCTQLIGQNKSCAPKLTAIKNWEVYRIEGSSNLLCYKHLITSDYIYVFGFSSLLIQSTP